MTLKKEDFKKKLVYASMGVQVCSYYQPIVCLQSSKIFAYEALIRGWNDCSGGEMAPAELFSCAEELHLSKEFDLLCQRSAFEFYKDFGRSREALLFLNINTSCISESLSEKEKITALTKSMGFHPSVIGLELIESEAKSAEDLFTFVQNQRESGFVIVVDDFGSEHSNLERLMLIRPDIIKIDRNIIHNVDKDPYRQSVLKSIHSLADMTGAICLAEGVETDEEVITCALLGIDLFQGFAFGNPSQNLEELEKQTLVKIQKYRELIQERMLTDIKTTRRLTGDINILADWLARQINPSDYDGMELIFMEFMVMNPEIECIYILNHEGIQISNMVINPLLMSSTVSYIFKPSIKGTDQSLKPYYMHFKAFNITRYLSDKYLSSTTGNLCRTLVLALMKGKETIYLCIDFLEETVKLPIKMEKL